MIFSSSLFIFLFLPITFLIYFLLNKQQLIALGKIWLVAASLFFYAYWDIQYLPLILGSIFINFAIGTKLAQSCLQNDSIKKGLITNRKIVLIIGIGINLLLLAYYKYTDFLIRNINIAFGTNYAFLNIVLPLAISFFTFTQIVYLVDSYRGETAKYNLLNYSLFVTFFPHLIAGPIVHHRQIMPQFESRSTLKIQISNLTKGFFLFALGLFKKIVIADRFAIWVAAGFDGGQPLGFYAAWATSLSYTFQLYFDFSGYCDMAVGISLLFNIHLPINFNSPYKALDIQDFWRRWHITLSNFLRDYLYIPLGGNRNRTYRTYLNLFITFVLGGLWHGATWMFIIWGGLHGLALAMHRLWKNFSCPLPNVIAWLLTFGFVNFAWVFFRARTLPDAKRVLAGMINFHSAYSKLEVFIPTSDLAWAGGLSDFLLKYLPANLIGQIPVYLAIILAFIIITRKNAMEFVSGEVGAQQIIFAAFLFIVATYFMLATTSTVFLYFNF